MIGKKLRSLRKDKGLSQKELAALICVSLKSVKNWELDISDPSLISLCRILDVFRISADEFLGRTPSESISLEGMSQAEQRKIRRALQAYMDESYSESK